MNLADVFDSCWHGLDLAARDRRHPWRLPVLATLAASASYIAAPAAVRIALPEASPGLYVTASLGITFPFNLIVGIPIYISIAEAIG